MTPEKAPDAPPGRPCAAGALLTCCVGHSLLIAAGFAGLSAPLGAFTGNTALLGVALLAGLVIAAFAVLPLRYADSARDRTARPRAASSADPASNRPNERDQRAAACWARL